MALAVLRTQQSVLASAAATRSTLESNRLSADATQLIQELVRCKIVAEEMVLRFCTENGDRVRDAHSRERFCNLLASAGIITQYQSGRILANQTSSLLFGNYLLIDRIAAGTVGIVFLAEHRFLKRRVALKILMTDAETSPAFIERFQHEGGLLAQIDHPNVVGISDSGSVIPTDGGNEMHYLAMEFVDGLDVEDHAYEINKPLEVGQTCQLMAQVARGLQAIHTKLIVHRDVKPSNMLLSKKGEVKLADFGIAIDTKKRIKYEEKLLGSLDFMPLEQSHDADLATPASDLYALGVSCFWLLTGHTPLPQAKTIPDALEIIRKAEFRRIKQYRDDVPIELDGTIMRMLERDQRRRLARAGDVAELLEKFADRKAPTAVASMAESPVPKTEKPKSGQEEAVYKTLAAALEFKDQTGPQRSNRLLETLAELCRVLGKREPWSKLLQEEAIRALGWGLRLTDAALLFLPERLSTSRSLLNKDEVEILKKHPVTGADFIEKRVREVDPEAILWKSIRDVVEFHHEKWDGSGTPHSLKEDAIPPLARIAAVIDTYEELRRSRKTKVGIDHAQALHLMIKEHTEHYDPSVLLAFQECEASISSIYANYAD